MNRFTSIIIIFVFTASLVVGQDWANLERYRKANLELTPRKAGEERVVFMGNSITQVWPDFRPEFFAPPSYICRGISGQTTPQMLVRFRQDVIDLNPDIVVVLAGTNDIAGNTGPMTLDEIKGNIVSMCELARANEIKVVLASVLPAFQYHWKPELQPAEQIFKLNSMLKDYADRSNIIYLDYFTSMADKQKGLKEKYTYDGVHPNAAGFEIMGQLAEKALETARKSP